LVLVNFLYNKKIIKIIKIIKEKIEQIGFTNSIQYNSKHNNSIRIKHNKMDLIVEPDTYSPSISEQGNYIDKLPPASAITKKGGIRCPCGSRKDKVYESYAVFSTHVKSKCHQRWLIDLNLNKANYYATNIELQQTMANQRLIIARLEKELQNKIHTIDLLTELCETNKRATENHASVTNLIDFD